MSAPSGRSSSPSKRDSSGPAPGARSVEAWFYEETEAGKTMLAARAAIRDQGAPFPFWFYMAPAHR